MIRLITFSFVLSLIFPATVLASTPPPIPSDAAITQILNWRLEGQPHSGIILGIIDGDHVQIVKAGSAGTARPLDDHTLFEIGSVTKTMTATILAEMTLAHEVALHDPVAKYLPSTVRVPSKDGKLITLLNLATQHSGLPRRPTNFPANRYAAYTQADLYAFLTAYRLPRDPGASYAYSNLGFGLLGTALSHAAKESYAHLLASRVFAPLGMTQSVLNLPPALQPLFAAGHNSAGDPANPMTFDALAGAGAVRSNLHDMLAYLRCTMGHGPLHQACLFAQQPRSTFPGGRIGLAWMSDAGTGIINHGGDTFGYHAMVAVSADRTRGIVILSNGPFVGGNLALHLIDPAIPLSPQPRHVPLAHSTLSEYVGTYRMPTVGAKGANLLIVRHGTHLTAQFIPSPIAQLTTATLYASAPDHFYSKLVAATVAFIRKHGTIVGLALKYTHKEFDGVKLGPNGVPLVTSVSITYPPVVALSPATLRSYVGVYGLGSTPILRIARTGNTLTVQAMGQAVYPIFASAKDHFYLKVVDATITFKRDANGQIIGMSEYQHGTRYDLTKMP